MASQYLVYGLSLLAGMLGAGAVTLVTNAFDHSEADGPRKAEKTVVHERDHSHEPVADRRAETLESSLRHLEDRLDALNSVQHEAEAGEEETSARPPEEYTPDEIHEQGQRFVQALDERHEYDPVDPDWAPSAEAEIESELGDVTEEMGFSVSSASCKTDICIAELEWPDHRSAREVGSRLAALEFPSLNCQQTVWLDPPEDPSARYMTKLYLDCTDLRAGHFD